MIKSLVTGASLALAIAASSASAATYSASSAISTSNSNDHSVWLSRGISDSLTNRDFDFVPSGTFTLGAGNTGTLTGSVVSQGNPGAGFDVSFNFANASTLGFSPNFKPEQGSVFNPVDGFFLNMTGGTLTGTGLLAGLNISATLMTGGPGDNYAVQVGSGIDATTTGANNKNPNFGMAFWFAMTTDRDAADDCAICDASTFGRINGRQGDVNIDLAPVPLPASALLLIAGLGGLGAMRARRKA